MIRINGKEVNVKHFPDGTQCLLDVKANEQVFGGTPSYHIIWNYENDEECMTLWYIVHHIRSMFRKCILLLTMDYVPNARMDRTKKDTEVFTLKYFGDFINALDFDAVRVFDVHSDVTKAVIDRLIETRPEGYINTAIRSLPYENWTNGHFVVYFPDAGSMKRYGGLSIFTDHYNCDMFYGQKVRNWDTGKIVGLKVLDKDGIPVEPGDKRLAGETVLMIDDIISYGGTLAYSADELKRLGAGDIYAYASHTEMSVLDEEKGTLLQRLREGTVKKVFTTDSIFKRDLSGEGEKYFTIV